MTGKAISRTRWKALVSSEPMLTSGTRLLLLVMAERMQADGRVKYPRPELADAVGLSERQVQRRLAEAVKADWLHRLAHGHNGRHAVYQATVPTSSGTRSGTPTSPLPVPLRSVPLDGVAGHLVSHSKDRASASERGALDGLAAAVGAPTTSGDEEGTGEVPEVDPDGLVARARASWGITSAGAT